MTLKAKTTFFSSIALTILIASGIIFQGYRAANGRLYQTVTQLEMVNHASHEIAIDILLDLNNVDLLKEHLVEIPLITEQLQKILPDNIKPVELINMEISFVRLKRVVDDLKPGQPIAKPLLEQVRNETLKINQNVAALKTVSKQKIRKLQSRATIIFTTLFVLLIIYILGVFFLLLRMIITPLLNLTSQVEKVKDGHLKNIELSPRKDEVGLLANEFNLLINQRQQAEVELKQEITEHKQALDKVKLLSGFLPICASCKQIRDDRGYWNQIETYIRDNSEVEFSHGICPECADKLYGKHLGKK